jgi:hypothetical protein
VTDETGATACDLATGTRRPLGSGSARWRLPADAGHAIAIAGGNLVVTRLRDGAAVPFAKVERIVDALVDGDATRIAAKQEGVGILVLTRGVAPITLADSHEATVFAIARDGARVAAIVGGHVRLWDVARPNEPRDLGILSTHSFALQVGDDAVITIGPGLARDGRTLRNGAAVDRWPFALPDDAQVRAWIQHIAPR